MSFDFRRDLEAMFSVHNLKYAAQVKLQKNCFAYLAAIFGLANLFFRTREPYFEFGLTNYFFGLENLI